MEQYQERERENECMNLLTQACLFLLKSVSMPSPLSEKDNFTIQQNQTSTHFLFISKIFMLQARATLSDGFSGSLRRGIGPVNLNFTIPNFCTSRLEIRYLQIMKQEKNYSPYRWVRYVTMSNSYVIRIWIPWEYVILQNLLGHMRCSCLQISEHLEHAGLAREIQFLQSFIEQFPHLFQNLKPDLESFDKFIATSKFLPCLGW